MKRCYAITGAIALAACLAGWAALAWGQPDLGKLPPFNNVLPSSRPDAADNSVPPPSAGRDSKLAAPVLRDRTRLQAPADGAPSGSLPAPLPGSGFAGRTTSGEVPMPPPQDGASPPLLPAPQEPASGSPPAAPMPGGEMGSLPRPGEPPAAPSFPSDAGRLPAGPSQAPAATPGAGEGGPPAEEPSGEASGAGENTPGRQDSGMYLEWVGPPAGKLGHPMMYALVVRNPGSSPVQQVQVHVRIPGGLRILATAPTAVTEGAQLRWDLGSLQPREERTLQLKMVAENRGEQAPHAWVSYSTSSTLHIKVHEPKLLLKANGPLRALVGDQVAFCLVVNNPGDGSAEQVRVHASLSDGLEHARGNKIVFDIGNLAPGESRNVTLLCASTKGGVQKCDATVEADGGLNGRDSTSVNVIQPQLNLQLLGPTLRYLGRKATYTVKVSNPGDGMASNVTVNHIVPEGYKVLGASDGGRHDFTTRTVSWFVGEVGPGQSREVHVEVQALNPGEFKHKAVAAGARGLSSTADLATRVEGLSALLLEMVDTEDPIEVNSDTAYEVRITNTGTKMETLVPVLVMRTS
jgi:uncharacterized repeat protein (TIGR01451 family)